MNNNDIDSKIHATCFQPFLSVSMVMKNIVFKLCTYIPKVWKNFI